MEIGILVTSRFQDADKYAAYLKTPAGRLRSELAWENMRRFLPGGVSQRRALDVGGGTGFASVQLVRNGFEVVLLDGAEQMLRIAREQAEAGAEGRRISFCCADAGQLPELFDSESFDAVVCHNVLEYVESPAVTVRDIARVLRKGAMLSVLVRNRAGEVLRAAIKSGDWELAAANLNAETVVENLYGKPVRIFSPAEVRDLLVRTGLEVVAELGVRVLFDYTNLEDLADASYSQIFDLESALAARSEFAAIARYIQVIARRAAQPAAD